jgi:uncharacterized membrane protein YkoI
VTIMWKKALYLLAGATLIGTRCGVAWADDHGDRPVIIPRITALQAADAAAKALPGAVTEVELESERGLPIYEVDITANDARQYEVSVDGNTGAVLLIFGQGSNVIARITYQQATDAALKLRPGTVTEVELESEHHQPIYEVDITASDGQRYEVSVDGNTGAVLGFVGRGTSVTASITLQQAADAAVRALPGTVIGVDLERKLGRAIYEVQIAAGDRRIYEVAVDGLTANVLLIRMDDD